MISVKKVGHASKILLKGETYGNYLLGTYCHLLFACLCWAYLSYYPRDVVFVRRLFIIRVIFFIRTFSLELLGHSNDISMSNDGSGLCNQRVDNEPKRSFESWLLGKHNRNYYWSVDHTGIWDYYWSICWCRCRGNCLREEAYKRKPLYRYRVIDKFF